MPAKKTTPKTAKLALDVDDVYEQSAVNLLRSDWRLLRKVADVRGDKLGGRRSVSAVIASLIEANRKKLESELP